MSLVVTSLNSGSNGNCYYVGNNDEAVLIDAGISCRETERRLKRLELSIRKIKAIFITHEHSDHIDGVVSLSKKYKIPVYITLGTWQSRRVAVREDLVIFIRSYEPVTIGSLTITGFPKFHDAFDPHSFIVSNNEVTIGIFTDIGRTCEHLQRHFVRCHAAFLESNYDEEMLETGRYPWHLKNRIRGGHGHLSNVEAVRFFSDHKPPFMSHLFPSHLSQHNNAVKLVEDLFEKVAGKTQIVIAGRYQETPVYSITNSFYDYTAKVVSGVPQSIIKVKQPAQLSLF